MRLKVFQSIIVCLSNCLPGIPNTSICQCGHTAITLMIVCIAANGGEREVPLPATRELLCCCSTGHLCYIPPPPPPHLAFFPLLYSLNGTGERGR